MSNFIATLDNRMNPIVVKELRQGLQSWFIIIIVNLMLVALSLTCILMVMTNPEVTEDATGGRDMFLWLQGVLFSASIVCVPLYVLHRLRTERDGVNVDLFFTTTLKPHKIVRGKFVAGMSLVTLLYSVCLPFMLFTYLLRGYDIPSMLFSLAMGYLATIPLMMAAIVVGTWTMPRIFAPFIRIAALAALIPVVIGLCTLSYEILREGIQGLFRDEEAIWVVFLLLGAGILVTMLLEAMAIGLLAPLSSNRTCRLRVWMTISIFIVAAGLAAFGVYAMLYMAHGPSIIMEVVFVLSFIWMIVVLSLAAIMLLIAICEPDKFSNRIMIQRSRHFLIRLISFPFTHGASGGILWVTIHTALALGVFGAVDYLAVTSAWGSIPSYMLKDIHEDVMPWILIFFSCFVAYMLSAKLIMRTFFPRVPAKHGWVAFLFIFMIFTVSTMVICFAIDTRHWDRMLFWKIFNPMAEISQNYSQQKHLTVRLCIDIFLALVMFVLCVPKMVRDARQYCFTGLKPTSEEIGGTPDANEVFDADTNAAAHREGDRNGMGDA